MAIFGEVMTAMVTPFREDLSVDYAGVKKLARHLVEHGSDALVVCGTTGESPTLRSEEKLAIFAAVREEVGGTIPIIAGTGSNDTRGSIELTREAEKLGVDGILLVGPYYNKPPQEGFYQHGKAVAESTGLPVIIYNVPGRTGKNIEAETIARLAEIPNIVAVKESSGDLNQVSKIRRMTPPEFAIYSGDDSLTLPILAVGGEGIISVASHIIGNEIKQMVRLFKSGKVEEAAALHARWFPIFQGIFVTANPIPIKYLLSALNLSTGYVRLPLVEPTAKEREFLNELLRMVRSEEE